MIVHVYHIRMCMYRMLMVIRVCMRTVNVFAIIVLQLPMVQDVVDAGPSPLTPRSTKKAFMETLLAPQPSALDEIYDEERAREVFVAGHNEVAIEVRGQKD